MTKQSKIEPIKYFAYVRKSSEGEERQALSIGSQIDKAREFFGELNIVEVLEEKHSAFKPYNRPVFASMIKRIEKGEARGIIAWHPDRLSRNEIDASTITYLVRTGVIHDLKFGSYNFDNSPEGIMMLQLALSQSQYFSSKLGKDVRRGQERRFQLGWHPNMCPNGYKNKIVEGKGLRIIETDKKRFPQLRQAFDLMLTGTRSVPEVLVFLNDDLQFKPKRGNKCLNRSALYKIFTNLFYAGIIEYGGKQKLGNHKAMISLEEYDQIQFILGRKGKPRNKKNDFAYTGMIKCAVCGCAISADRKFKVKKSTGTRREYTYYCCTHKNREHKCKEGSIEVKELEKQIDGNLAQYELSDKFRELFFATNKEMKQSQPDNAEEIVKGLEKQVEQLRIEKSNLVKMSCKNLITDEDFQKQQNEYELEVLRLSERLEKIKKDNSHMGKIIEDVEFAILARAKFHNADNETKKQILKRVGSNRLIQDRKLIIEPYKWLIPVPEMIKPLEAQFYALELDKKPLNKRQNEALTSLCLQLRKRRDSNS